MAWTNLKLFYIRLGPGKIQYLTEYRQETFVCGSPYSLLVGRTSGVGAHTWKSRCRPELSRSLDGSRMDVALVPRMDVGR